MHGRHVVSYAWSTFCDKEIRVALNKIIDNLGWSDSFVNLQISVFLVKHVCIIFGFVPFYDRNFLNIMEAFYNSKLPCCHASCLCASMLFLPVFVGETSQHLSEGHLAFQNFASYVHAQ